MIARLVWMETKVALGFLGPVLGLFAFIGWTGEIPAVEVVMAHPDAEPGPERLAQVSAQALAATITFVPVAFLPAYGRMGPAAFLPSLVALPISRLTLGIGRHLSVILILGSLLALLLLLEAALPSSTGSPLVDVSAPLVVSNAFASIAVVSLGLVSSNVFPRSTPIQGALGVLTLLFVVSRFVFRPEILGIPLLMGAVASGLVVVENASFLNRKAFI